MRTRSLGNNCPTRRGFSLIEIMIVVIILGILAAIVIPQFTSASTQSRTSSMESIVQTLRQEIALYKLHHGDTLPDLQSNGLTCLTQSSSYNGTTFPPYLLAVPVNPLTNGSAVKDGNYAASSMGVAGADFVYDYQAGKGTGNIWGAQGAAGGALLGP